MVAETGEIRGAHMVGDLRGGGGSGGRPGFVAGHQPARPIRGLDAVGLRHLGPDILTPYL